MKELSIEEIKQIQLDILKKVDAFCTQNNITYFLAYGTLLGAIRHKGYIPWDDDIDIIMPRNDYDKFLKCFNKQTSNIKVISPDFNKNYPCLFAKIHNEDTTLKEQVSFKYNIGINIDLSAIDYLPNNKKEAFRIYKRIGIWEKILQAKIIRVNRKRSLSKNTLLIILKLMLSPFSYSSLIQHTNRLINNQPKHETPYVSDLQFAFMSTPQKRILNVNIFKSKIKVLFEGCLFNAPIGYDEWLRSIYGDYMQLPPLEKQVTHHAFKAYCK